MLLMASLTVTSVNDYTFYTELNLFIGFKRIQLLKYPYLTNHCSNHARFFNFSTFNWTIPFLSYLLMVILLLGTIVLYMVPLRYLLLAWGINKFTKRIRKPNAIPNNELLDFLSRIPSDPEVVSVDLK